MSKIILPGEGAVAGKQIFVPKSAMPAYRCTVPTGPGAVCGAPFYEDEFRKFVAHAAQCARDHEQQIHERSPRTKLSGLQPWDPEYADWMRNVGERMKAEGRVEQRRGEF